MTCAVFPRSCWKRKGSNLNLHLKPTGKGRYSRCQKVTSMVAKSCKFRVWSLGLRVKCPQHAASNFYFRSLLGASCPPDNPGKPCVHELCIRGVGGVIESKLRELQHVLNHHDTDSNLQGPGLHPTPQTSPGYAEVMPSHQEGMPCALKNHSK